ncbi:MAG: zinc-ribbon domain-containing protein [Bacillus subtilis]|nr:zinc-ribbon domain-containing protein [Bacillus subtilis]
MKCNECGRELKIDSRFCDWCGAKAPEKEEIVESKFNANFLFGGIAVSLLITLLVTGLAQTAGFPLLFGAYFCLFFWRKIKKTQNK